MKKKILIIICGIILVSAAFFIGRITVSYDSDKSSTQTEISSDASLDYMSHEAYRMIYNLFDYEDKVTYVIGHKSPDTDTVTSAIAMAGLLKELGINAEAKVAGEINNETAYVLSYLGISSPEILESAADCQLWLVDHSEYTQAVDGAEDARIVGIVDHHGIGSVANSEQIIVRSGKYGSTTAEVYSLYKECGIAVSEEMAGVMLAGLISDTNHFTTEDNVFNRQVYNELLEISGIEDVDAFFDGMIKAKLDYSGKTDNEILHSDYKEYETQGVSYGIGNIEVATYEEVELMAERMQKSAEEEIIESNLDYLFYNVYDNNRDTAYVGCVSRNLENAQQLLNKAFSDLGEITGDYVILKPYQSRKSVLVPAIVKALS